MGNVGEIVKIIHDVTSFTAVYAIQKCFKSMLCGIVIMPALFLLCRVWRRKNATACCYCMLMLIPMAFMGMSRLFYQKYFCYVTAALCSYAGAWLGVPYFCVMLALIFRFMQKNRKLGKKLKRCPQIAGAFVMKRAVHKITAKDRNPFQRYYLRRVDLYLADTDESPFSGGILRPYIVMPRAVWEGYSQKDCMTILCHELMHIKSGHIVWLTLFRCLTFWWWINPLVYLCENRLREYIELACDESCIFYAGLSGREYGGVLLSMVEQYQGSQSAVAASFSDVRGRLKRDDFSVLKRRIGYIAGRGGKSRYKKRIGFGVFLACMAAVFILIAATSYPRFTLLQELAVYNEDIGLIAYDTPLLREAFLVEDGTLSVNSEKFDEFIASENITDEYIYVSFECIMKLPGMGGGGNVGMVNVQDPRDIFYLAADTWTNRMLEFYLKYLI